MVLWATINSSPFLCFGMTQSYIIDCSAGNIDIMLPDVRSVAPDVIITLKRIDDTNNICKISVKRGALIDSTDTYLMKNINSNIYLYIDASTRKWRVG